MSFKNHESLLQHNMKTLFRYMLATSFRPYYIVLVLYFAHILHSYALAGSLLAMLPISQAFFEVPTGIISDKIGRVFSIKLSVALEITALLIYTLLPYYWMLALGSVILGSTFALTSGNNDALIYDSARNAGKHASFHSYYSKINIALEVSGFVAAILAGFLAARSFALVMWVSIVPQLAGYVLAAQLAEPERVSKVTENIFTHFKDIIRTYKENVRLRALSLASILGGGVGSAKWNMQPAYYSQFVPLSLVGVFVSCNYLWSTIGFYTSDWFMKRFKPINILLTSEVYSRAMSFLALGLSTIAAPITMALSAITYGPQDVAMQHLLHEDFTDAQRATMASLNSLLTSIVYGLFLIITGFVADKYGLISALVLCNVLLLPVIFIYRRIFSNFSKKS